MRRADTDHTQAPAVFATLAFAALLWMTIRSLESASPEAFAVQVGCLFLVGLIAAGGVTLHLVHWLVLGTSRNRKSA